MPDAPGIGVMLPPTFPPAPPLGAGDAFIEPPIAPPDIEPPDIEPPDIEPPDIDPGEAIEWGAMPWDDDIPCDIEPVFLCFMCFFDIMPEAIGFGVAIPTDVVVEAAMAASHIHAINVATVSKRFIRKLLEKKLGLPRASTQDVAPKRVCVDCRYG